MKILHLINYFNDNLSYQENFLTEAQIKSGHTVQVITSDRFYPFKNYDKLYLPLLGKRIIKPKKYKINNVSILRKKAYFETKSHAQCLFFNLYDVYKFDPDVIHIHNTGTITFIFTFFYSLLFKKKLFIDCHQDFKNTRNTLLNKINNKFWTIFYGLFTQQIKNFLPINEASKNFIIKTYKINEKKIIIVPLGYESFKKPKNIELLKIRKKYSYNSNDIIIINSGKINKDKKIMDLIDLLEILLKKNKNFKLILVGKGEADYIKQIKRRMEFLNSKYGKVVKWLNFQNLKNLRKLMCISDISIWPGTPSITIQESLYCENLLFLPKSSPSYSLIKENKLNFYNKNLYRTSHNILKIFKNKNLQNKIKIQNKSLIKKLDWNFISNKLLKIYES